MYVSKNSWKKKIISKFWKKATEKNEENYFWTKELIKINFKQISLTKNFLTKIQKNIFRQNPIEKNSD